MILFEVKMCLLIYVLQGMLWTKLFLKVKVYAIDTQFRWASLSEVIILKQDHNIMVILCKFLS